MRGGPAWARFCSVKSFSPTGADQADIPLLTFLQVQQRHIARVRADLNEHGTGDLLGSVEHRRQRPGIGHLSEDVERQDQQRCGIHHKFGRVHRTEDFLFVTAQGRLRVGDTDFDLFSGSCLSLGRSWFLANRSASSSPARRYRSSWACRPLGVAAIQ